jgi:biopolymer transport protein ExbB/TolQ
MSNREVFCYFLKESIMAKQKSGDTEYLLLTRALIIHAIGVSSVILSYRMGWLQKVISTDTLYISRVIIALGVFTLVMGTAKLWSFTRELNIARGATTRSLLDGKEAALLFLAGSRSRTAEFVKLLSGAGPENRGNVVRAYVMKLERKASSLDHFLEILPMLGLFGTVVGIISAFSALDPAALDKSGPLALPGFMIALITTAVGICFTVWFIFIRMLIGDGVGQLTETLLALDVEGEKNE